MSLHHYTRNECLNTIIHTDNIHASSGNESGLKTIHEFGHNLNVDTNYKTLWSVGTTYSYLSNATILKISSSDTNDDDGDNGARTVLVQGLDTHYNEIEEIVTLDGQNAVNTSKKYLRVFEMIVQSVGSSGYNEGIIYAGTGTITLGVPANIYAEIPAQYNQTMMAVYTIPNNKTGYMTLFYAQPDDSKGFQTQLIFTDESGIFRVKNELHAYQSISSFNYKPYLKIEEKTDIELRIKIDQGTAEFGGGFSIILVDNE